MTTDDSENGPMTAADDGAREAMAVVGAEAFYTNAEWSWAEDELDPEDRAACIAEFRIVIAALIDAGMRPPADQPDTTAERSVEWGAFLDTGQQVGVGTTANETSARDDVNDWRSLGYDAALWRRRVGPWQPATEARP